MTAQAQTFDREVRYIVIKHSDAAECLGQLNSKALSEICEVVESYRAHQGKPPLQCVAVESDWPIYEQTWEAVQRLAEGREQLPDELRADLNKLREQNRSLLAEKAELVKKCEHRDKWVDNLATRNAHLREVLKDNMELIRCGIGANYGGSFYDKKLEETMARINAAISDSPETSIAHIQAKAVMNFGSSMAGAFESGFVDSPVATIGQVYQVARHHVKDHYQVDTKTLAEEMGEEFAKECCIQPQALAAPQFIRDMAERITTQDNRVTADPFFNIFQKREIVVAEGYGHDRIVWTDEEGNEADEEMALRLEAARDEQLEDEIAMDGGEWVRLAVTEIDEFVTGCFTEEGCKQHLEINGHNLRKPFIYATSLFRNNEMLQLREWIMSQQAQEAAQ